MTHDELIAIALDAAGLGVRPGSRDAYAALITGGMETEHRTGEMLAMSGCGLVVRGLWRRMGVRHPILDRPYRTQRAISDLVDIARDAGVLHAGMARTPQPGDAVIVGPDNGAPEHVYTVLAIEADPYDAGWCIEALDGGQRDDDGHQVVRIRDHVISGEIDRADGATEPGAGVPRRVRWVIDVTKLL